ncbi:MAG: hypothetical protein IJQ25_00230 [Oscillibacter sp.]|nr:hypothetical protein [Oscillibacter sp.]
MTRPHFDEKFRLLVPLEAQSPMIHFQARETGATLRATEVKPKFDRFLLTRLRERGADCSGMIQKRPDSDKRDALKYRMRIYCPEAPQVVSINNGAVKGPDGRPLKLQDYSYSLFYGNSGRPTMDEQTMGILSDPVLEIQCLHAGLRKVIEETVTEFFLTTNFGTMQSKGFGSFAPAAFCDDFWLNDAQRAEIGGYLKRKTKTEICYYMAFDPPYYDERGWNPPENVKDFTDTFEAIRCFYQLMKSGYNGKGEYERSFLFRYMHGLGIGNEKAWMKQQGISPAIGAPAAARPDETPRYVRALLGTAGNLSYQEEPRGRVNVTISSDTLPRVPSPVFFKVVKDTVFITAFPVPTEVYGQRYKFTGARGYGSGEISTPEAELFASGAFDIRDFMARYVEHYNNLLLENALPKFLRGAKEVRPL